MIAPPAGVKIWLAAGVTDMRRGFDGLAAVVAQQLKLDPFSGAVFIFRGRRGHLVKVLFWDGQGLVLYAKRLERGRFVWPTNTEGMVMRVRTAVSSPITKIVPPSLLAMTTPIAPAA